MLEHVKKDKMALIFVCVLVCSVVILINLLSHSYNTYRDTILRQQQENLQFIATVAADTMRLGLQDERDRLAGYTASPSFCAQWAEYREGRAPGGLLRSVREELLEGGPLSMLCLLDGRGELLLCAAQEDRPPAPEAGELARAGPGSLIELERGRYALALPQPLGQGEGLAVGLIELRELSEQLLASIPVGRGSYLTAADERGTVIMHPAQKRVGSNYFLHMPLMDSYFEQQSRLRQEQYARPAGTGMYQSRWWQAEGAPLVTKIAGYTRMEFGGHFWVVSAVMDADKALALNDSNLISLAVLVLLLFLILAVLFLSFWQMYRNRRELLLETENLKVLNRTLADLNQSQAQVRHYQRLQTIGNFANGIAHEFNNLLTPILGLSELLKEELAEQEELRQDLETIHQSGLKAREITRRMLTFGRKGQGQEAYAVIPMEEVLQEALGMVRAVVPPTIRLELELRHGAACCFGSKTQLQQVLLNLCSNSYQAMEGEGGVLSIRTRLVDRARLPYQCESPAGAYILVTVSDTGCGMDSQTLEQIFDPYFTTKESGRGTGLGLAVAQSIVAAHDGLITVESAPGQGSRFDVYLPQVPQAFVPAPAQPRAVRRGWEASILAVDDSPEVARTLARTLGRMGHRVRACTDALEALELLQRSPRGYDLLITDHSMPGCSGSQLARRVRALRKELPVLLITGLPGREQEALAQSGLFAAILPKPLDFQELCRLVEELLA